MDTKLEPRRMSSIDSSFRSGEVWECTNAVTQAFNVGGLYRVDHTGRIRGENGTLYAPHELASAFVLNCETPPIAQEFEDEDIHHVAVTAAAGENPKDSIGIKKPSLDLVPAGPLYEIAGAFKDGASKYAAFNWRERPVKASVYYSAALRHIHQWHQGQTYADDSGVHHLAHAGACLLILLDAAQQGSLIDDRPTYQRPLDDIIADLTEL